MTQKNLLPTTSDRKQVAVPIFAFTVHVKEGFLIWLAKIIRISQALLGYS